MLTHIMLDLESWGTSPYSTITSVGACVFDPYTEDPKQIITHSFEVAIDPTISHGLRNDPKTILWWMAAEQDAARVAWMRKPKLDLPVVLDSFADWLRLLDPHANNLRIWGNGSDFDNTLLAQAYEVTKRDVPWSYWQNRCFRTLRNLTSDDLKHDLPRTHTALADAEEQAIQANRIIRKLGIKLT